jgi:hypothetical protein
MSEALTAFLQRAKDLRDEALIEAAVTGNVTTNLSTLGVIELGRIISEIGRAAFLEQSTTGNIPLSPLDDLMQKVGDIIEGLEDIENPTPGQTVLKALFAELSGDVGTPCPCGACNETSDPAVGG